MSKSAKKLSQNSVENFRENSNSRRSFKFSRKLFFWRENPRDENLKLPKNETRSRKAIAILLIIFASVGLLASFSLSVDAYDLAKNPDTTSLSCSINAVLNCLHVMRTPQAEILFGIPNSFFGMIAFPVLITIGVVLLVGWRAPKNPRLTAAKPPRLESCPG